MIERLAFLDKVILGIGNPGAQYTQTRHNVGFRVIDRLMRKLNLNFRSSSFKAVIAEGHLSNCKFLLVKPMTYVNLSGESAQAILSWYKLTPSSLFVVCDDFNLPFAKIRIRSGGSSGGHHGLDSIIQHLNTAEFPRLRIGIGNPIQNAAQHVLSKFTNEEENLLEIAMVTASEAILSWLEKDSLTAVMNCYNNFTSSQN